MPRLLQDLFVDRDRQLANFRRTLTGQTSKRLVLVSGGPGLGKSWLLRLFIDECAQRNFPHVLIDFSDNTAYDTLLLTRRFRDAFGVEHFNTLTQMINDVTIQRIEIGSGNSAPINTVLSLGTNNNQQDANISISGNVAGGSIIKDNLFVLQSNSPANKQELENRVTEAFFTNLSDLSDQTKVVFLFDTYERTALTFDPWTPAAPDRWISNELLRRMREGQLPNTVVVLAGRRLPTFGSEWGDIVGTMLLDNFTQDDVAQYLRDKRGLQNLSNEQVQTLFSAVQGNPQLLGVIGDNLEYPNGKNQDDQW